MSASSMRLGPVRLEPGVSRVHASFYLYSAFMGVLLTTFISVIQPYVLITNLGLAADSYGTVAANMVFYGEILMLALSSLIGAWSDRFGRRAMFVIAVVILAIGYVFYGYVDSVSTLTAVRVFMSIGIAIINVMIGAIGVDYPDEASRGKLVAMAGIVIGFANILIGVVFLQMPSWFVGAGFDALAAGRGTLFVMAGLAILMAVLISFGLKGGRPEHAEARESVRQRIAIGLRAGRENARIALAYGCAFVARGDLVVVGTFFSLWLTKAGIDAGMPVDAAARNAGIFFALVMTCALLWAPVMGYLNDRLDRVVAMAFAMFVCAIAYIAMGLVPDPLGFWMYPACVLLGIAQISAITASQTLIGQEAPKAYRGSIVGTFSMCGAAGVLFITGIGGRLYDAVSPQAPFLLIGAVNAVLFGAALMVRRRGVSAAASAGGEVG